MKQTKSNPISTLYDSNNQILNEDPRVLKKKDVPDQAQQVVSDKMDDLYQALALMQLRNNQIDQDITNSLSVENPKMLETIMEHIILQWDDIVELLFEELIHEEVQELNKIEYQKEDHDQLRRDAQAYIKNQTHHTNNYIQEKEARKPKYQDYRKVDLKDVMSLFDDYKQIESSIKNRL